MKHILTIICLMLALSVCAQGQQSDSRRPNVQQRQGWSRNTPQQQIPNRSGQFSPTEYWNQQKSFFTEKAGLTEDEAAAFFPLYNELQQKKRELNREIRRLSRQENQTEEQAQKTLDATTDINIKIAELEKEYVKKFREVLPASKILKVQNAEEQFNSQMLKDIQQSRGHQFQQGPQLQQIQPRQGQTRPGQSQFGHRPGQN